MLKRLRTCLNVVGLFLALGVVTFAADAPRNEITSFTDSGEVIQRTLRPNGTATDQLPYAEDQILVRFKDTVSLSRRASAHGRVRGTLVRRYGIVRNLEHVRLPRGVSVEQAIKSYRDDPDVLYAEPNYIVEALRTPNDPSFGSLWGLHNTGQAGGTPDADIDAPEAWDITTGSSSVIVAVIDTGVDYNHQDLSANMWRNTADCNNNNIDDDGNGYIDDCYGIDTVNNDSNPIDDHNHGTHVAGTIGAVGNNGVGVVGVNWNVSIMACKFLDASGFGSIAGAIACLEYVKLMKDRGVNIVATNNSWGGGGFSQALYDAIDAQRQRGILFIAAAGNASGNNDATPAYPASYYLPNIISVAATDRFDGLAFFSNYGSASVHLGAPGLDILSTTIGNTYSTFSGTSMATPHVTGVAALLKAQNSARDWRAIKNLILAGGNRIPSLTNTVTQNRLNANGALNCSNFTVVARLRPQTSSISSGVGPIDLSALHINCANPNGQVNVTVNPGGQIVTLRDDGLGFDQVAADGIYSAQWTPPGGGTFALTFPDGDVVTVQIDTDLKAGFPVKTFHGSGSYHAGPAIHTLVGNMDNDPNREIVVTGLASGPLYAWKSDGSRLDGWPLEEDLGVAYPALGELSTTSPGLEVVAGHFSIAAKLAAYSGTGAHLPGWPRNSANYTATPPSLADVDGDGVDEIFLEEEDWLLHGYRADGSVLLGWPPAFVSLGGQERHTPAIADLDGDGDLEIVTTSGSTSNGTFLFAYHHNGTPVANFPISFNGNADTFPVIADVDGDGRLEIIFVARGGGPPWRVLVYIVSNNGTVERIIEATGSASFGTAPALADLDGDGLPEIIVQTEEALDVFRGDGSVFPGWPVTWSSRWLGNSAPVVGDVDGDGFPDIVVTTQFAGSSENGEVRVYNRNGILHPRFPKMLKIGSGGVPAIADIDLDGRNEIIITGSFWNGVSGDYDKVWVYDLGGPPHGPVQWGQFMGGPKHQGYYGPPPVVLNADLSITKSDSPDPVTVGNNLTYTLLATNNGPDAATGVVVTDTLPSGVTFVSSSATQGSCSGTSTVTCNLGNLANGATATVTVVVRPTTGGAVNNTASVAGNLPDPNTQNNSSTASTAVNIPTVSISASDATATEAGATTGIFTVSRTGGTATALTVNYTASGTATSGNDYVALAGSVTIPSGSATATITVTPVDDALVESSETVIATLAANAAYTVGSPSSATVTITDNDGGKDLVIENLGLSASSVASGGSTTVSHNVANRGTVTVTETYTDRIYLSTDQTYDAADILLGSSHGHTTDLAPNATHPNSQAVTIPGGTAPGNYFILVRADALAVVVESNETNNVTAAALTVTASAKDLVIENLVLSLASVAPGGSVTVSHNVVNRGTTTVPETYTDRIYLSTDQTLDAAADTLLGTSHGHTTDLAPNALHSNSQAVTIPVGTAGGNYFILVRADALGAVAESNEANNVTAAALTVTVTGTLPTVTITATDANAAEAGVEPGTLTVTRTGSTSSALTVNYTVSGTATNGTDYSSLTGTVTIPAGLSMATVAVTPIDDSLVEGNESVVVTLSANAAYTVGSPSSGTVTISDNDVGGKDLVIENLGLSASSVAPGGSTTVSHNVVNRGTVTVTETYTDRIYLSTNQTLDAGDTLLGSSHGHTADLAPNATHTNSQSVTIPVGTAGGNYFILVRADALSAVVESNELNNVTAAALTVTLGQIIIDNSTPGASSTGSWCVSGASGFFGSNSLYSCGSGVDTYRWTPTIPSTATYDVYVWWTAHAARSTNVPITVVHGGGSTTRNFNEQTGGGQWVLHGRYTFNGGTGGYVETSDVNGMAAADAVRWVPVP